MTSPQNTKPPKWVFRSTPASLEAKQFSRLAVLETLFVLILYIGLAYYFHYQWWLLLAALAAPLILLRSKPSIAYGFELLKYYHNRNRSPVSFSKLKIIAITITSFIASSAISYYLASTWLTNLQGWELFFSTSIMSFVLVSVAFSVAVASASAAIFAVAFAFTLAFTVVDSFAFALSLTIVFAGAIAFAFAIASAGVGMGISMGALIIWSYSSTDTNKWLKLLLLPFIIFLYLAAALGIWLHSLSIRLFATLRHPIAGLKQLPDNMQEILLRLDFTHLPELLPKAKEVDKLYSVDGIMAGHKQKDITESISLVSIAILWYIPAVLWRWSLKATVWLWLPIALLLRPPLENKTLDDVRDHAVCKVTFVNFWILPILSGIIILWLLQLPVQQTQTILELLPEWASSLLKLLNQFPSLELGLRYVLLLLCCLLSLIIWYKSHRLASWHKTLLADEFKLKELNEKGRERFRKRVESLEIWCTIRIFFFIFFGYSILLYLAYQCYPDVIVHLIPAGLSGYL